MDLMTFLRDGIFPKIEYRWSETPVKAWVGTDLHPELQARGDKSFIVCVKGCDFYLDRGLPGRTMRIEVNAKTLEVELDAEVPETK